MSGARSSGRPLRLDADPEDVGRGLSRLVVVVLELLREVLERQAIRRMDGGDLSASQIEDLGKALIEVRASLEQLRRSLGVTEREADDAVSRARRMLAGQELGSRGLGPRELGPQEQEAGARSRPHRTRTVP